MHAQESAPVKNWRKETSEKIVNIFGFCTSWPSICAGWLHNTINFPGPSVRTIDTHGEDKSLEKICAALGLR